MFLVFPKASVDVASYKCRQFLSYRQHTDGEIAATV